MMRYMTRRNMRLFEMMKTMGHEQVMLCHDEVAGYRAIIAIHNTKHGAALQRRGILYVPDYLANAGGVINGCIEMLNWEPERAMKKVNAIYETALDMFALAQQQGIATSEAADRLAEQRLQ
jgi:leucine dehydrogenase